MASSTKGSFRSLSTEGVLEFGDGYRTKAEELGTPGYPVLRVAQVLEGRITPGGVVDHVRDEFRPKIRSKLSRTGDIVLTTKGTFGRRARVQADSEGMVYSPQVCYFRVSESGVLDAGYLYYWLGSEDFVRQAQTRTGQTDMADYLSLRDLASIEISLPSSGEQRAIAHILGTLDDKIDLNRRMAATLEEIAKAVFKAWFVDRNPPAAQNDLRGWRDGSIADLAEIAGGSTPSTKEPAYWLDGTHAWVTPRDLSKLSTPVLLSTERRLTDAGLAQIGTGLLPSGTVLMSSRAPIGYVAIAEIPTAINQGFIAMKPKAGVPSVFLWLWAALSQADVLSRANGSTFLEISKSSFRTIPVSIPSPAVLHRFDQTVTPLYKRIVATVRETETLIELRDALLPKLISGELRVKDAERFLKEAV